MTTAPPNHPHRKIPRQQRLVWTSAMDHVVDRCIEAGRSYDEIAAHLGTTFTIAVTRDAVDSRIRRRRLSASAPSGPAPSLDDCSIDVEIPDTWEDEPEPAYVPNPQRGPTEKPHYIPEGHELAGVSRLKDASGNLIQEWDKTRVAGADAPPVPLPPGFLQDRASVMRRGDGSTVVQWTSYKRDDVDQWEAIKTAIVQHVAEYVRPAEPIVSSGATDADLLTVYPLGDPHIGMLAWGEEVGENFDLKIAEEELCECMRQLVARSPASERAIVTNLGDLLHAQDDRQLTPKSGHKLDVDGRAAKVGRVALRIFRTLVDAALTRHKHVLARSIPGNHDPNSFWIAQWLAAVYANDPRVTVDESVNPYQYDVFGKNLIGWCHGDGAKPEALGEIMASDVPELWGQAGFRFWHGGHVHHDSKKELRGCTVETHRTLAARDAWTHHSGYRSGRSLKAITYHREYGPDSVAIVGIERVRAAIGRGVPHGTPS